MALTSKGWQRIIFLGCMAFFAMATVMHLSMTAVAVVVAMTGVAMLLLFNYQSKWFAGGLILFVVFAGVANQFSEQIPLISTFKSKVEYRLNGGDTGDEFSSYRKEIFNSALFSLKDFPLFGAGDRHFGVATSHEYLQSVAEKRES